MHILQHLHECVNFGATKGYVRIDMDLVLKNHNQTMGVEIREENYEEFKRSLERPSDPA